MPPSYLDFQIDISPDQNGLHEIVARSPAGEQRAAAQFPLIGKKLKIRIFGAGFWRDGRERYEEERA